jgi:glycosyltransferase involved in cell wall biosynthesis
MPETVAILICTYGDRAKWDILAARAEASVQRQRRAPDRFIRFHGKNLQHARTYAVDLVKPTDWLCFCDADDELEEGYLEAMMKGSGDLRYPSVRYVSDNVVNPSSYPPPQVLPRRPLLCGNFMVIGTLVRRSQFLRVGGFDDYEAYEDWALWIKCWIDGAKISLCRDAIYRAHMTPGGRNIVKDPMEIFERILRDMKPRAVAKGLINEYSSIGR